MHYLNMALIDKASLLMVPSTYEAGTLYNVLPSGNRAPDSTDQNSGYDQTRADFTFDRGTDHGATRIGSDGLIKKYRENVLTESNNFSDSDWTLRAGASVTGGQSGYDGTNNAWLLNADTTGTFRFINQATNVNTILTNSIYAKAGSANYIGVTDTAGSSSHIVYFDLSNGTIDSVTGGSLIIDYKIEAVGTEGWYRCSAALTAHASGTILWFISSTGGSVGNAGDNIYIQNAQAETSMVATDYLDSGATTAKAGVLIDLPRINYDANGENGSLLLEPQRQQLLTQSEYISSNDYVLDFVISSNNEAISPEGVQNAALISGDGSSADHALYELQNLSVGTYTLSAFVKKNTQRYVFLAFNQLNVATYWSSSVFDLDELTKADYSSGTYSNGASKIEDYGNGWYRISLTASIPTATDIIPFIGLASNTSAPNTSRGRYAFSTTDSFYLYGFQAEAGSYATSYIPNHGESGGVTRAADSCLGAASDTDFNTNEGVVFAEFSAFYDDGTFRQMGIAGSTGNEVNLSFDSTSNRIGGVVRSGGTYYVLSHVVSDTTINTKVALKYKVNDLALYVDGVEVDSLSSAVMPTSLNEFNFAVGTTNSNAFYGNVKQLAVFNEALSDSELETLTTL